MGLNEKSEGKKLYACTELDCHVVTFTPNAEHPVPDCCPGCGDIGLLIRGPVLTDAFTLDKNRTDRLKREREEAKRREAAGEVAETALEAPRTMANRGEGGERTTSSL